MASSQRFPPCFSSLNAVPKQHKTTYSALNTTELRGFVVPLHLQFKNSATHFVTTKGTWWLAFNFFGDLSTDRMCRLLSLKQR